MADLGVARVEGRGRVAIRVPVLEDEADEGGELAGPGEGAALLDRLRGLEIASGGAEN